MSSNHGASSGPAEKLREKLDEHMLVQCMRCGFCLPSCPTYRETGQEAASPRGRIALMKAAVDGLMEPDDGFRSQLDLCLGCRACEPACPAGVAYGALLEQAREAMYETAPQDGPAKRIERLALRHLFPFPRRLRVLGFLLALWKRAGLGSLLRRIGLSRLLPAHLLELEEALPAPSAGTIRPTNEAMGRSGKAPLARVALFRGCVMDVLFSRTHENTVRLLTAAGYEVIVPEGQACCGALHAHAGDRKTARELAIRNIRAFRGAGADRIVSNAGGCGAMMHEYGRLLSDEPEWREQAEWFSSRVKDLSTLLSEGRTPAFRAKRSVRLTWQDSCHLRSGMGVSEPPRELLRSIREAEYAELFESGRCCGSAGIYNLLQPEMSSRILDEKMGHVRSTGASLVVTANPGCLLQLRWGIKRAGLEGRVEAVHLADVLAECLAEETNADKQDG